MSLLSRSGTDGIGMEKNPVTHRAQTAHRKTPRPSDLAHEHENIVDKRKVFHQNNHRKITPARGGADSARTVAGMPWPLPGAGTRRGGMDRAARVGGAARGESRPARPRCGGAGAACANGHSGRSSYTPRARSCSPREWSAVRAALCSSFHESVRSAGLLSVTAFLHGVDGGSRVGGPLSSPASPSSHFSWYESSQFASKFARCNRKTSDQFANS